MNVLLKEWNRARRYWILDTSSGSARASGNGVCHGFLAVIGGDDGRAMAARIAAAYADDGKLWFQVDGRRWNVEDVEFEHEFDGAGMSRFAILSQGEVVLDIMYPNPADDPVNRLDLSFDELDLEMQDIFYFMSKHAATTTWRAGVLSQWDRGMIDE